MVFPSELQFTPENVEITNGTGTADITISNLPEGITIKTAAGDGTTLESSATVAENVVTVTGKADGTADVTITLTGASKDQGGYTISVTVSGN